MPLQGRVAPRFRVRERSPKCVPGNRAAIRDENSELQQSMLSHFRCQNLVLNAAAQARRKRVSGLTTSSRVTARTVVPMP